MATITYTGASIPNRKVITITSPGSQFMDGKNVQIGMGSTLLSFTGFNPTDIVNKWLATENANFQEVFPEAGSGFVKFTHNDSNADFFLTVLVDGVAGKLSAKQRIEFNNGPDDGTFTLTFNAEVTDAIDFDPEDMDQVAEDTEAELIELDAFALGDVSVTGGISDLGTPFLEIEFGGAYEGLDVALMTVQWAGLLGGNSGVSLTLIQDGSAPQNEVQTVLFDVEEIEVKTEEVQSFVRTSPSNEGSLTYTFNGQTTASLPANHTHTDLNTALVNLATPVAGDFETSGGPLPKRITVRFKQNYAGVNVPQLTYTGTGANAKWEVSLYDMTGGTFLIGYRGVWTDPINWDDDETDWEAALEANPFIGVGNVTVTNPDDGEFVVELTGALANTLTPYSLELDVSDLEGVEQIAITESIKGVAGRNRMQSFIILAPGKLYPDWQYPKFGVARSGTVSGGYFRFKKGSDYSEQISWNADYFELMTKFNRFWNAYCTPTFGEWDWTVGASLGTLDQTFEETISTCGDLMALTIDLSGISIDSTTITGGGSYTVVNIVNGNKTNGSTGSFGSSILNIKVNFGGHDVFIPMNASEEEARIAMESNPSIGVGNIRCIKMNTVAMEMAEGLSRSRMCFGFMLFEFIGNLAGVLNANITCSTTGVEGGSNPNGYLNNTIGVLGLNGTNERQILTGNATTGEFYLTDGDDQYGTPTFPWNASAAVLQDGIRSMHESYSGTLCTGGPLGTNPVQVNFRTFLQYTDVPMLKFHGIGMGYNVTKVASGFSAPVLSIRTDVPGSTQTVFNTVGDSYTMRISPTGSSSYYLISGIPYNVTADQLETMINAVMGPNAVSCDDGPHPDTAIEITFGGQFANTPMQPIIIYPTFAPTITRQAQGPVRSDNVFELTIVPDEGTLGFNDDADFNKASFNLTFQTDESSDTKLLKLGDWDNDEETPETWEGKDIEETTVRISLVNINAQRIEDAINEHFGRKVVSVTRIIHSQEWAPVTTTAGGYFAGTKKFYCWYYRGVYRLTFINEFADPATITGLTLSLPLKDDESPQLAGAHNVIDPYDFMKSDADVTPNSDDGQAESNRIAQCFQAATTADSPIHLFRLDRLTESSTPTDELTFRYQIQTQFKGVNSRAARASVADLPPDLKMQWVWGRTQASGQNTQNELYNFQPLTQSEVLDWDASPEQHRAALEAMIRPGSVIPEVNFTGFFGEGNVRVEGSLMNSWLPNPDGLASTAKLDSGFECLKVTLVGRLANLNLQDQSYELKAILVSPYIMSPAWMVEVNPDVDEFPSNYQFLQPVLSCELEQKPLPPFGNERQRFDLTDALAGNNANTLFIGYGDRITTLNGTASVQTIQNTLNSLSSLGSYPRQVANSEQIVPSSIQNPPLIYENKPLIIPTKVARSVTVFGTTPQKDPFEVEFTGYGFQNSDCENLLIMGGNSKAIVTTIADGSVARQEIHTVTAGAGVHGGTWTYTIAGSTLNALAYNITASALDALIEGIGAIGAGKVECIGGPLNQAPINIRYATSLGNLASPTITSAFNSGSATSSTVVPGGTGGTLQIEETVPGAGPSYYNNPDNYDLKRVPHSEDTLVLDDATTPIRFGLDQSTTWVVVDTVGKCQHDSKRRVFMDGQKVYVDTTDTLPVGLEPGYYFIVQALSDGTFRFAETSGGTPIELTGNGVGTHSAYVKDLSLMIYSRYSGDEFGLPRRRANNLQEYLPQYFRAWFASITIGEQDGSSISLGRFDTMDAPTQILIKRSQGSTVSDVPALLFLVNNGDDDEVTSGVNLLVEDGDVGVSVYSEQSSTLHNVKCLTGDITLNNCTVTGDVIKGTGDILLKGQTTSGGIINI